MSETTRKPRQHRTVAERAVAEVGIAEVRVRVATNRKKRADNHLVRARAAAETAGAELTDAKANLEHARRHPALPKPEREQVTT